MVPMPIRVRCHPRRPRAGIRGLHGGRRAVGPRWGHRLRGAGVEASGAALRGQASAGHLASKRVGARRPRRLRT
jgi:hypothetical protein